MIGIFSAWPLTWGKFDGDIVLMAGDVDEYWQAWDMNKNP
jgi:hypothetical protein